jgi:hypothetical protein
MNLHQQILKDNKGNDIGVFVPMNDYNDILDRLEELEDIKDYDEVVLTNEDTISLRDAIKLRKQQNG